MHSSVENGCLSIRGAVTVQTITPAIYTQFVKQCMLPDVQTIDLHGVVQADSTCISLLLTALRQSKKNLKFSDLPESVRALAELYEIQEWIPTWTPDIPVSLSYSHSV